MDGTGVEDVKTRLWEELRPVPKGTRVVVPASPVESTSDDLPSPAEANDDVLTEDKLRNSGFLDLPVKKRKAKL